MIKTSFQGMNNVQNFEQSGGLFGQLLPPSEFSRPSACVPLTNCSLPLGTKVLASRENPA